MTVPFNEPMTDSIQDISREASGPTGMSLPVPDAAGRIVVPADVIARSRPAGYSVPIARARRKIERPHPWREAAIILVIGLLPLLAVGTVMHLDIAGRLDRHHVSCATQGAGRFAHPVCQ